MSGGEAGPVRRLFGTDGVRGVANEELTPELALAIGRGLGVRLEAGSTVLIGRDTRRSGAFLEAAVAAGLASAGVDVELGGVLPTPAVAELVARGEQVAGVVISASHNPFPDNGIKLFGPDGFKLPDEEEALIEAVMADDDGRRPTAGDVGDIIAWPEGLDHYRDSLVARFEGDLSGLSVVLDCAHGATVATAADVVSRSGAQVLATIGATPTGDNINVDCGSTSLNALSHVVVDMGADLGLAFDGDGDRVLAVDGSGTIVDGDQILAILALRLKERRELAQDTVVTTTMTNLGFRRAMRERGVEVRWTDVGDRYVVAEMRSGGFTIGGEQSGHLINLASGPTGDGVAAGLQLLHAVADSGGTLTDLAAVMERLPQKLVNYRVADKSRLADASEVWDAVARCESELGEDGRVVVRPSGTEPLVRVMVEAPTADDCDRWCDEIGAAVTAALGK